MLRSNEENQDLWGKGMAFTQDDLDAIEEAIASGALIVEYNDRKVEYRKMGDLIKARNLIRKKLGLTAKRATVLCDPKKGTC